MGNIVSEGVSYSIQDISTTEQKKGLLTMIERGNHKSATKRENNPTLAKNYDNKVRHGVTIESLKRIKGLVLTHGSVIL